MPYTLPNSQFFEKLQDETVLIAETIDLFTPGGEFYWTTTNDNVSTLNSSGDAVEYTPFPGQTAGGTRQSTDLTIETIRFVVANSGGVFDALLVGKEIMRSSLVIRRFFTDTPGLGAWEIFRGDIGDFKWTRDLITGQVRDEWDSHTQKWPYYNYQDLCIWKFGGAGCGIDVSSFTVPLSIDASSSTPTTIHCFSGTLTQSFANDRLTFGKFSVTFGANSGHVRSVRAHSGDVIELSHRLGSGVTSIAADVFPGCRKRLIEDCTSLYDNSARHNSYEWTPLQEEGFA